MGDKESYWLPGFVPGSAPEVSVILPQQHFLIHPLPSAFARGTGTLYMYACYG